MRLIYIVLFFMSPLFAENYSYLVKEEVLQERMIKEFPITKQSMFLTFHISNPKLSLDGQKQRFNFTAKLEIPNIRDGAGKVASAVVSLSSRIGYSKGGNLYLKQIKVVKIESDFIGNDMKSMLYGTIESALNEYYKSRPLYSLKDEKGIIGMTVNSITNVVILDEGIKVIF